MINRESATDALCAEIERDLCHQPGSIALIFCLDEVTATAFTKWLDQQRGRPLRVYKPFERGAVTVPAGNYRIAKSGVFSWPDDGPPIIAPVVYVPCDERKDDPAIDLGKLLSDCLEPAPASIWCWWLDDDACADA